MKFSNIKSNKLDISNIVEYRVIIIEYSIKSPFMYKWKKANFSYKDGVYTVYNLQHETTYVFRYKIDNIVSNVSSSVSTLSICGANLIEISMLNNEIDKLKAILETKKRICDEYIDTKKYYDKIINMLSTILGDISMLTDSEILVIIENIFKQYDSYKYVKMN